MYGDKDYIEKYIKDSPRFNETEFINHRKRWYDAKVPGQTRWKTEEPIKDKEYYHNLETIPLTKECFKDAIFGIELGIWNEPIKGLAIVEMYHNGFNELLQRDDLWQGILSLLDSYNTFADGSYGYNYNNINFSQMRYLFKYTPLKDQIKGREKLFYDALEKVQPGNGDIPVIP